MTPEQAAPKPYFDEEARLNPLHSIEKMQAASPYFARLFRRFTWLPEGSKSQRKRTWRSLRRALISLVIFNVIVFFLQYGADLANGVLTPDLLGSEILYFLGLSGVAVVMISVVSDLLLDFAILSLRVYRDDGEWELLRLSSLSRRGLVVTVFAYWRLALRARAVEIFQYRLLGLILIVVASSEVFWLIDTFLWNYYAGISSQLIVLALIAGVIIIVLLAEPYWRLNGMTGLATALAYLVNEQLAMAVRIGALVLVWGGQVVIAWASWALSGGIVQWASERWQDPLMVTITPDWFLNVFAIQVLLAWVFLGVGLWTYFRLMRYVGLRLAYRVVLREDGA
jgi:hypothetical protein